VWAVCVAPGTMSVISNSVHINGGLPTQPLGAAGGPYSVVCGSMNKPPPPVSSNNDFYVPSSTLVPHQPHPGTSGQAGDPAAAVHLPLDNGDAHQEESPEIDIIINNVVCSFSVRCHLNLKRIAMEGAHVEFKRENGMLNMKLRRPNATATIWSSGKITCTGSTSEEEAKVAARRIARRLQKLGYSIRFSSYRVVNVLGTTAFPFGIKLNQFSNEFKSQSCYEPELHPGVTYRIKEPRATCKVFSTGSITVTAPSVQNVQLAIEHIYPLCCQFKMERTTIDRKRILAEKKYLKKGGAIAHNPVYQMVLSEDEDEYYDDDDDEYDSELDDLDSDESCE